MQFKSMGVERSALVFTFVLTGAFAYATCCRRRVALGTHQR